MVSRSQHTIWKRIGKDHPTAPKKPIINPLLFTSVLFHFIEHSFQTQKFQTAFFHYFVTTHSSQFTNHNVQLTICIIKNTATKTLTRGLAVKEVKFGESATAEVKPTTCSFGKSRSQKRLVADNVCWMTRMNPAMNESRQRGVYYRRNRIHPAHEIWMALEIGLEWKIYRRSSDYGIPDWRSIDLRISVVSSSSSGTFRK